MVEGILNEYSMQEVWWSRWRPSFGVKLMRPGVGPAAELPTASPA
jgi:hypothetical protein